MLNEKAPSHLRSFFGKEKPGFKDKEKKNE